MAVTGTLAGYVLHSRRYSDSSLLIELFVRERGRAVCIAKGALRRRKGGAVCQPFQQLAVEMRGRGEVTTLTRAEPLGAPVTLVGQRLYCGLYLNELLLRLTARDDAFPTLFDHYAEAVAQLGSDLPLEPVLRRFEVRLLGELGLGLSLDHDSAGRPIQPESLYTYDVTQGAIMQVSHKADCVRGLTLLALGHDKLTDDDVLHEARSLMRRVLDFHLDGRPLRSRELFR